MVADGNKLTALKVSKLRERGRYSDGHGLGCKSLKAGLRLR
jgi:hypothetical protein